MRRQPELDITRRQALERGALVTGACLSHWLFGSGVAPVFGQSPERDLAILNAAL